ncbi:MAG: hypothetical protein HY907_04660 [Deltaproteobacteria bacterium]|nr:hypothetical protein [Deltaproteobacteria bacterium]
MNGTMHRVIALAAAAALGACGEEPPEAHPLYLEVRIHRGLPEPPCARNGIFEVLSTRDLKLTAVERIDGGAVSCVVPVDPRHERFLLYAFGCRLGEGETEATVRLESVAADGAHLHPIKLDLGPTLTSTTRDFGPGIPLLVDLELSGQGDSWCWFSGTYVRTTDARKLWGPYRLVSQTGTFTPNDDRRGPAAPRP